MLFAELAVLVHFQSVGIVLLVLHRVVISLFALRASQRNLDSHLCGTSCLMASLHYIGEQIFAQKNNLASIPDFFNDPAYATPAIISYCIWTGFGTNLILMTGAMARIPEDVLEAAQLDGISWGRELISIILPMIWPTFTTLIVMTFVGIFTSSGPILLFTRGEWDTGTISYFIFQQVYFGGGNQEYAAAVGIFFTIIAVPIILLVKKLMERWQDAVEY